MRLASQRFDLQCRLSTLSLWRWRLKLTFCVAEGADDRQPRAVRQHLHLQLKRAPQAQNQREMSDL
jgi:hypothetical protein